MIRDLLEVARPVTDFTTQALHELIADMFDTMVAAGGVGLAAPQIGIGLQVVIFGFESSERYPDAEKQNLKANHNLAIF